MKNVKYFIPIVILLILPWTHRLLVENMQLAIPWVPRNEADGWMFGLSIGGLMLYGLIQIIIRG